MLQTRQSASWAGRPQANSWKQGQKQKAWWARSPSTSSLCTERQRSRGGFPADLSELSVCERKPWVSEMVSLLEDEVSTPALAGLMGEFSELKCPRVAQETGLTMMIVNPEMDRQLSSKGTECGHSFPNEEGGCCFS